MSSTIGLVNGKYIIVDDDDAEWVRSEEWRWVVRNMNNGWERIFIESANKRQRYLHNLFFPDRSAYHAKIEFLNDDPFDFRRANLFPTSYYTKKRYSGRVRGEAVVRTIKAASVGVLVNKCVIAPTNAIHRPFVCCTCSYIDEDQYMRCLDVAAHGVWAGWGIEKKSDWCEELDEKIKAAKRKEKMNCM